MSSEAVVDGYHVFLDGQMVADVTASQRQFVIQNLDTFTNYTVMVLAYNRISGAIQLGSRSDQVIAETLGECKNMLLVCTLQV